MTFPRLKDIPKNIKLLGLISFFTDMSSDMIFPVLPIYLRNVLGINEATIGLIDGVANSTAEIVKVFSGGISDYLKKRKAVIFAGYFLSTIAKPLFAFANAWPLAFAARVADRIGKGVRGAPKNALVSESTDAKHLGVSFGFDSMLDTLGAVAGTLILFLLLNLVKLDFRTIFFLSFIPATIALVIIVFGIKDPKTPETQTGKPALNKLFSVANLKQLPPKFYIFLIISCIFSLGNISYSFLILKANDMGLSQNLVPIFYFLYSIIYAGFSYPMGALADKLGKSVVVITGYISFVCVILLAIFSTNVWFLVPMFVFYGIFLACNDGPGRALVAAISPPEIKGTSIGLYQTVNGLITLFSNTIFGMLWVSNGSTTAFMFSLACGIVAVVALSGYKIYRSI